MAASSSSSSLPVDSPDFSSEESLDELRALATSAGAEIAGEFTQRKDRPDPATLIGKGKLEEIAGAAASVSADVITISRLHNSAISSAWSTRASSIGHN